MKAERLAKLRAWMAKESLDALVVSKSANMRYLTGFTGEGLLVIDESAVICTDSRFSVQAAEEAPDAECLAGRDRHLVGAAERLSATGARKAGFEAEALTYAGFETLKEKAPDVELVPSRKVIENQRAVKDPAEIELIEAAAAIADRAFEAVRPRIQPGITEREAALELERHMILGGGDQPSFPTIIAGGPNGAKPHATPGERPLQEGDLVVLDWGIQAQGYCSDCTRTLMLGEPDNRQREVYDAVRAAQLAALDAVAPGVPAREVDGGARDLLDERGLGEHFGHGVGHGVGLEVHELPAVGRRSEDDLEAGMVITIEPGVYIEGWGGVRLEELVLVTADGARVLTGAPYDL